MSINFSQEKQTEMIFILFYVNFFDQNLIIKRIYSANANCNKNLKLLF